MCPLSPRCKFGDLFAAFIALTPRFYIHNDKETGLAEGRALLWGTILRPPCAWKFKIKLIYSGINVCFSQFCAKKSLVPTNAITD